MLYKLLKKLKKNINDVNFKEKLINLFKKKEINREYQMYRNNRYFDVIGIYGIKQICDGYVLNNINEKIYYFNIKNLRTIFGNNDENEKIAEKFKTFLKSNDYSTQILTRYKKINAKEYVNNIEREFKRNSKKKESINNELSKKYFSDLTSSISQEMPVVKTMYLVIKTKKDDYLKIKNIVKLLEETGVVVQEIIKKEDIINLLYNTFKKEEVIYEQ